VPHANKFIGVAAALALALIATRLLLFVTEAGRSQFMPMSVERPE